MKTADELTGKLKEVLGEGLKSVVLYGSAAVNDQTKKYSDINVLVIVDTLELNVLKSTMPLVKKWIKAGNPPPLFFTETRFNQAADVFPIEFMDIKAGHKVLFGDDKIKSLAVQNTHLRHQLEYELRSKLIQLRERFLETEAKKKEVRRLLALSISTFAVLFKSVLRLLGKEPPRQRKEVLSQLNEHVKIRLDSLNKILLLRDNDKDALNSDPEELIEDLIISVEAVLDFVNQHPA